ncbi:glycosyltransferase [Vibrio sp. CAU 1672]|uniref:glycosyltransferase n=1 Tax=Vibrio sp. CAU 1672 TaxID=3032594 RepID=UPI0023DB86A6|nr:glycosyltransferase [Vibrio sp. CAU 1672]MDF2152158.1 glycosyltransferase [Vibrio sp. CAU 1672]
MDTPRRILYVHYGDNWIRGSEVVLLDLISNIDRHQFEPFVWTNCRPLHDKCLETHIASHHSQFNLVGGWQAPRWDISGWNDLIKQGIALIKELDIDLVHVNSGAPCQWMSFAARMCNVPLVTHLHCNYQLRDRFTLGLHLSPRLICVSQAVGQEMLRDGYPADKLDIVHNGVSIRSESTLDVKSQLGIPTQAFTFISVGSLIQRKGFDRLIQAMRLHNYHEHNPHLVIVGEGEERERLQALAQNLNVADRIHMVGEQHNIGAWLTGNVDAFISGAYDEAFGLVLGEAALAKLPIVAPRVGGIPEVLKNNHSALLYKSSGMAGLLNSIQQLLQDALLCQKLADNAYQHAKHNLTVDASVRAIESIYLDELNQHRTAQPLSYGAKPLSRWLNQN